MEWNGKHWQPLMGATARDTIDASEAKAARNPMPDPAPCLPSLLPSAFSIKWQQLLRFGVDDARVFIFKRRLLRPKPICPRYGLHQGVYYTYAYIDTYVDKCIYVYRYVQIGFKPFAWLLRSYFVFFWFFLAWHVQQFCVCLSHCPCLSLSLSLYVLVWGLKRNPIRSCHFAWQANKIKKLMRVLTLIAGGFFL